MMVEKKKQSTQGKKQNRLDIMMDEPSVNPRYAGMTMREMVRKVVLRKRDAVDDPIRESDDFERE